MKRIKVIVAALALAVCSLAVHQQVSAAGFYLSSEKGETRIAKDRTIDSSAYLFGEHVIVEGTIKGDLYCAGQNITITGKVEGDVLCAGANVSVGGPVDGDVRIAGNILSIKDAVAGNVAVAGNEVKIERNATVGYDLTGGASDLTIDGSVGRDVMAGASTLHLSGKIGRDMNGTVESLVADSSAKIGGDVSYTGSTESTIPSGVVAGKVNFHQAAEGEQRNGLTDSLMAGAWIAVTMVVLAVLATLLAPRTVHNASAVTNRHLGLAFLAGFATLLLAPMLAGMLMMTVVGMLAGIALLFAWMLMILLSSVFVSYAVGERILRARAHNALIVALVGAGVLGLLLMIPILNIAVFIAIVCIGIGLQVMYVRHQYTKHSYRITT